MRNNKEKNKKSIKKLIDNRKAIVTNDNLLLHDYFSTKLNWNSRRIEFLVLILGALIKVQTVNYERLACSMESEAKIESRLRRIQRFFAEFIIDKSAIAKLIFSLLPQKENLLVSIDRTNWQFGKTDINIFMLSVCYQGVAFPLLWQMLPKKGNSNCKERITLLDDFIKLFGSNCIGALLGDREFIGKKWQQYLIRMNIPFHLRVKENMWFYKPSNQDRFKISWLLQGYKINQIYHHPKLLYVGQSLVYLSAMKLQSGEYLSIISYNNQVKSIENYKERWQIETMFKGFKTNGFNMEDTHLNDVDRIDKLVAILSVAFAWAYKAGIYVHEQIKAIKIKAHGRKAYSFFRYGLNFLQNAISVQKEQLRQFIMILFDDNTSSGKVLST